MPINCDAVGECLLCSSADYYFKGSQLNQEAEDFYQGKSFEEDKVNASEYLN